MPALATYTTVGIREDLADIIYNISPTETPFMSGVGKTKATNTHCSTHCFWPHALWQRKRKRRQRWGGRGGRRRPWAAAPRPRRPAAASALRTLAPPALLSGRSL